MNLFDPLTWAAESARWSLFARTPLDLVAQFFIEPDSAAAGVVPAVRMDASESPSATRSDTHAQWLRGTFTHEDEEHAFRLYVPAAHRVRALPLVVMLHGAQQDADDFASGTGMNIVAEEREYIVLYPEQSEGANPFRCWNWFKPIDWACDSGEPAMLLALTRAIVAKFNADETRVYVAGLSAGGAMAVNLVVRYPDRFAAAAIHSGIAFGVADEPLSALCAMRDGMGRVSLPETVAHGLRTRAVPLIVFHGDADDTVHPRNSEQIVKMGLHLHDCQDPPTQVSTQDNEDAHRHSYTRHVFDNGDDEPVVEQWSVHGLGHAWSGGRPQGSHTDARGPDASAEIIRFFGRFALDTGCERGKCAAPETRDHAEAQPNE
ncbi:PHB depolymerase family esterase [Caballeronia temeraria]|uniref:PHB depolymerase family esterase n=1 Tax=Caballeronia temeraria TaxID=1777137 RepID=A0A158DXH6_9BURK|nr:PHB depolymerase family esterase [Caballeronia temeraria]SAK98906.1 PHB depolymerase family esterase [Caballeronia temeraria]